MKNLRQSVVWVYMVLGACAPGGPQLNPELSAKVASSASEAATTPTPDLRSEDAVKPPGSQPARSSPTDRAISAAIENAGRPATDRARDAQRQSAAVLNFFGITPGMTVLDLYSGGGYYTELLSLVVGPNGHVVAHNNTPYLEFARNDLTERFKPGRLTNVERLLAENNQLDLPESTFDAVLMTDVYHDVYHVDEEGGWPRIDAPKLLAEIYSSMKPRAVLGVVDHVAAPGSPPETGETLHRIDPALLKRDLVAAGFVLDGESEVLRNPADDHTKSAFDASIRGRTDQVVLRFRRPR